MPLFSVIVPAFNAQATLDATLDSVASQSCGDFEALLINDGSRDGTLHKFRRRVASDSRFRLISQANSGPSVARNRAAAAANGRYLAFLDADDIWTRDKLALSAAALAARPQANGVFGRIAFFRDCVDDARTLSRVAAGPLTLGALIRENPVCTTSNLVVERALFLASGGFDPALSYAEDLEWLVRAVAGGVRIESIDQTLVCYRASDAGLSVDLERMHEGWRRAIDAARRAGAPIPANELAAAEAAHLRYLARRALRVKTPRGTALRYARRALAKSPSGFFSDLRRGGLTLAAAAAEALFPDPVRRLAAHL